MSVAQKTAQLSVKKSSGPATGESGKELASIAESESALRLQRAEQGGERSRNQKTSSRLALGGRKSKLEPARQIRACEAAEQEQVKVRSAPR